MTAGSCQLHLAITIGGNGDAPQFSLAARSAIAKEAMRPRAISSTNRQAITNSPNGWHGGFVEKLTTRNRPFRFDPRDSSWAT